MFCCSPFVCTLVMVSVGIFSSGGGNFELDLTSYKQYLFYIFITEFPLLLYLMCGRRFILFFLCSNILLPRLSEQRIHVKSRSNRNSNDTVSRPHQDCTIIAIDTNTLSRSTWCCGCTGTYI